MLRLFARAAVQHPDAFGHLLQALDFHLSPTREVALVAPAERRRRPPPALAELAAVVRAGHRPHLVLAGRAGGQRTARADARAPAVEGRPAAYVCEHFACQAPVTEPEELEAQLAG